MCSVAKVCVNLCRMTRKNSQDPFGVHYVMFIPMVSSQCLPEQRDKWLPLASSLKVVGTYAQTELAHGQSFSLLESWGMFIQIHRVT